MFEKLPEIEQFVYGIEQGGRIRTAYSLRRGNAKVTKITKFYARSAKGFEVLGVLCISLACLAVQIYLNQPFL